MLIGTFSRELGGKAFKWNSDRRINLIFLFPRYLNLFQISLVSATVSTGRQNYFSLDYIVLFSEKASSCSDKKVSEE